jgi:hypothetical protein
MSRREAYGKYPCGFDSHLLNMPKCSMCDEDADIVHKGKYYCMKHWHIWGMQQKKVCLDWEIVEHENN